MSVTLSPLGGAASQFFDNNGQPLSGGKIYTYTAGTTTPEACYTSANGSTPHSNPIVLDSAARVPNGEIWLSSGVKYKFVIHTALDVLIGTYDNIQNATAADNVSFTGFKGQNGFVSDLADNDGSDWVGFSPNGASSISRSAQDKMQDVLSVKDFGAVGNGSTNDTVAVSNAISAALSSSGGLFWPNGVYALSSIPANYNKVLNYGPGVLSVSGTQSYVSPRKTAQAPVTIYVDKVNGTDGLAYGYSTGSGAVATIQYAYFLLANLYDHNGFVPTIQCAGPSASGGGVTAQVHTAGLVVTDIDDPVTQTQDTLVGCQQINLDLGGSTIKPSTGGRCVVVRGPRLYILLSNAVLDSTMSAGDSLYVYGGGAEIGLGGGITFKGTQAGWSMMQASRAGRIHTVPNTLGYTIDGSAGFFAQSIINGGSIELEGVEFNISTGLTFDQAFLSADSNSSVSIFNCAFTGSNITGRQYKATKGGLINTNAQYGGQSVTIDGATVVTNNYGSAPYSSGLANTFIPGTIPGEFSFANGIMTDPGTPTVSSGGGTGVFVQGVEPGFNVVLGAGATSPVRVNFASGSSWQIAQIGTYNIGVTPNIYTSGITAPSGSTPGYIDIFWSGGFGSTNGIALQVSLNGYGA